ncbi:MAG: FG-GAP repeat protein [Sandaracinus sp.]
MKLDSLVGALAGVVLLLGAAPVARAQPLDVSWAELTPGATLAAESFWGFTASFDGERIAMNRPGAIDVYRWNGTTATLEQVVVATSGDTTGFPDTIAIDHGRLVASARYAVDGPAVYEFLLSGTTWSQATRFVNPRVVHGDPLFSTPVIQGSRLLIGQPYLETARGSFTVLRNATDPFTWTLSNSTSVGGTSDYELLGQAMAIDGADVLISALRTPIGGVPNGGLVRLYHDTGTSLDVVRTIENPTPADNDQFGIAVDLDATRIYVGARYDDTMGTNTGAVYIYDRSSGALVQTFFGALGSGSRFGESVAVDRDWMAVGAPGTLGTVVLYRRGADGMWHQRNVIPDFTGASGTGFGQALLVDHALVVAASSSTVGGAAHAGRAWVGIVSEPDGGACAADDDCTHGHCVDGICCNTACSGACDTCGAGTCIVVECDAGVADDAATPIDAATSADAGVPVDAASTEDAGALGDAARSDGGGGDASRADGSTADGGGVPRVPLSCTCRASARARSGLGWAAGLFGAMVALRRARRRAR